MTGTFYSCRVFLTREQDSRRDLARRERNNTFFIRAVRAHRCPPSGAAHARSRRRRPTGTAKRPVAARTSTARSLSAMRQQSAHVTIAQSERQWASIVGVMDREWRPRADHGIGAHQMRCCPVPFLSLDGLFCPLALGFKTTGCTSWARASSQTALFLVVVVFMQQSVQCVRSSLCITAATLDARVRIPFLAKQKRTTAKPYSDTRLWCGGLFTRKPLAASALHLDLLPGRPPKACRNVTGGGKQ